MSSKLDYVDLGQSVSSQTTCMQIMPTGNSVLLKPL